VTLVTRSVTLRVLLVGVALVMGFTLLELLDLVLAAVASGVDANLPANSCEGGVTLGCLLSSGGPAAGGGAAGGGTGGDRRNERRGPPPWETLGGPGPTETDPTGYRDPQDPTRDPWSRPYAPDAAPGSGPSGDPSPQDALGDPGFRDAQDRYARDHADTTPPPPPPSTWDQAKKAVYDAVLDPYNVR
jgi:hypothetical protein